MIEVALFGEEEGLVYDFGVPQAGWEQVFDDQRKMENDHQKQDGKGPWWSEQASHSTQSTWKSQAVSSEELCGNQALWTELGASPEAVTSVESPKEPQSEKHLLELQGV